VTPWHNKLRARYGWYHRWHLWPFANLIHWAILVALISVVATVTYSAVKAAENTEAPDHPNTVAFDISDLGLDNAKTLSNTAEKPKTTPGAATAITPSGASTAASNPTAKSTLGNGASETPTDDNDDTHKPPTLPPEETEPLIDWEALVADLDIFNKKANETIAKLDKFEEDEGSVDQQNTNGFLIFLTSKKANELTTTVKRSKKKLGTFSGYNQDKKTIIINTGKKLQTIDLLQDRSLKEIEFETKKNKLPEEQGDVIAL